MPQLTEKQKKLPPALQKAILAKQEKDDKKTKPKMPAKPKIPPKPKRKY